MLAAEYTAPSTDGSQTESFSPERLPGGGTYSWELRQKELVLQPTFFFRLPGLVPRLTPYAGIGPPIGDKVWMGMVSQAGVTLGLTLIIAGEYPTWGATVQTLVVSLIALHQLVGPVLFRAALSRAGEIGKMDARPAE